MKKIATSLLIVLLITLLVNSLHSQTPEKIGRKSVFIELVGNGLFLSANYDARFTKKENGFGFRVGLGFYPETYISSPFVTFPFAINHLAGKGPHYFESSVGATIIPKTKAFDYELESGILFFPTVGYRFAKIGHHFQLRVSLGPMIGKGGANFSGGLSFGYKF